MLQEIFVVVNESNDSKKGKYFESLISEIFAKQRYLVDRNVNVTGQEFDLICTHKDRDNEKILVECKAKESLASRELSLFNFKVSDQGFSHGIFVYNKNFESQAKGTIDTWKKEGKYRNLSFWNGEKVIELLVEFKEIKKFEFDNSQFQLTKVILFLSYDGFYYISLFSDTTQPKYFSIYNAKTMEIVNNIDTIQIVKKYVKDTQQINCYELLKKENLQNIKNVEMELEVIAEISESQNWYESRKSIYNTIDLFCGIGGIRKGFELTNGFQNLISAEIDKYACITYKHLYGENPYNDVTSEEFKEKVQKINYDVLLAGFPTQLFLTARNKDTITLLFHVVDIIRKTKPKAFLLENILRLYGYNNDIKIIIDTLVKELNYKIVGVDELDNDKLKYNPESFFRKTIDFGLPQKGTGTYIVGFSGDIIPNNYSLKPLPLKSEKVIFNNLYDLLEKDVSAKYYLSEQYLKTLERRKANYQSIGFQIVNNGDNPIANRIFYLDINRNLVIQKKSEYYGQIFQNRQMPINNQGIRVMTPIEWARLQGFKDYAFVKNGIDIFSFPKEVSERQQYKQLENSVSIPVIEEIAYYIYKTLEEFSNGI